MGEVVSIINMKGGVGKTTLTVNLAYALANFHGKKVLVADVDPQFNATQYFLNQKELIDYWKDKNNKSIMDILLPQKESEISIVTSKKAAKEKKKLRLKDCSIEISTDSGKLTLIPSTLELIEVEFSRRGTEQRLEKFVSNIKGQFDFILIDCPPTLSVYTLSAYLASDSYILPVKPDYLSSLGLPLLERALQRYNDDYGKELDQLGIVFTMVDARTNIANQVMSEIKKSGRHIFKNYLSQSVRVAEAIIDNQILFKQSRAKQYGDQVQKITEEFLDVVENRS